MTRKPISLTHRTFSVAAASLLAAACMAGPAQQQKSATAPEAMSAALLAKMASRPVTVKQLPAYVHQIEEPEPAGVPEGVKLAPAKLLLAAAGAAAPPTSATDARAAATPSQPAPAPAAEAPKPAAGAPAPTPPPKAEGGGAAEAQKMIAVPRATRMMGKVPWRHGFHTSKKGVGIGCQKCHHEMSDGEAKACYTCHTAKGGQVMDAKTAYHQNCISCHKKAVAKDPSLAARAPVGCKACHSGPK